MTDTHTGRLHIGCTKERDFVVRAVQCRRHRFRRCAKRAGADVGYEWVTALLYGFIMYSIRHVIASRRSRSALASLETCLLRSAPAPPRPCARAPGPTSHNAQGGCRVAPSVFLRSGSLGARMRDGEKYTSVRPHGKLPTAQLEAARRSTLAASTGWAPRTAATGRSGSMHGRSPLYLTIESRISLLSSLAPRPR